MTHILKVVPLSLTIPAELLGKAEVPRVTTNVVSLQIVT